MRKASSLLAFALLLGSATQEDLDPKVASLLARLKSDDPAERTAGEDELVKMGEKILPALEQASRGADLDLAFRINIVRMRISFRDKASAPKVKDLAAGYANRGHAGRLEAIRQLAAHPDAPATAALIEVARLEKDAKVKSAAIDALGYRREAEAREALEGMLEDASAEVRAKAFGGLRHAGPRAEVVARGLQDQDMFVREAAAQCVGALPPAAAVAPLLEAMFQEAQSRKIPILAVQLCRRFRDAKWVPRIEAHLKSYDKVLQAEALTTLVRMRLPESAKALLGTIRTHVAPENRETLRRGVVDAHHPLVVPDLIEMMRSGKPEARDMAAAMLWRLSAELGCPVPRPKPVAAASLKAKATPPDEGAKSVVDGEWNEKGWLQLPEREDPKTQKKIPAVELEVDLGREASVCALRLIVPSYTTVDVSVSTDGKAFEALGRFQSWRNTSGDLLLVNRKARAFRFSTPKIAGHRGCEYREIMVLEMEAADLVAAWEEWWKQSKEKLEAHAAREKHGGALHEAQEAWAAGDARRALERVGGEADCIRGKRLRGALRQAVGEADGALADLKEVTKAMPEDWASWYYLAAAWAAKGKAAETLDALERSVQAGLSDAKALQHAAFAKLAKEKRYLKLLALLSRSSSP